MAMDASNVCCRKENSFQDRHCIGHDASANISNKTKSDITQKLKQGNIFWKILIENTSKHYYSLVTENVDSLCQTKTAGRGEGVYVLVIFFLGGGVDHSPDQTGGKVCVLVFGGDRRPCQVRQYL